VAYRLLTYLTMSTQTKGKYVRRLAIVAALSLTAFAGCAASEESIDEAAGATGEGSSSGSSGSSGRTATRDKRAARGPQDRSTPAPLGELAAAYPAARATLEDENVAPALTSYPPNGTNDDGWGDLWKDWVTLDPAFDILDGFVWTEQNVKVLEVRVPQVRDRNAKEVVLFYRNDLSGARIGRCDRNADNTLNRDSCTAAAPEAL
jgi:hypothetical protein